jgi:hypothetical protein
MVLSLARWNRPGENLLWIVFFTHPCHGKRLGDFAIVASAAITLSALLQTFEKLKAA